MHRTKGILVLASIAAFVAGCSTPTAAVRKVVSTAGASAEYTVTIPSVADETFHVDATLRGVDADTITYYFPVWAPGAYDIVNYGAYVRNFRASRADGNALAVLAIDSNTYRIIGGGKELRLSYDVHDIEHKSNSAWFGLSDIEPEWAFANGTALFGYPDGYKDMAHSVTYSAPEGWMLSVALDPASGSTDGQKYVAANYDELVDAPVQMGTFQQYTFDVKGVPHIINVSAPERLLDSTGENLVDITRRIVEAMSGLFGEIPYKRYVFQHYLVAPRGARGNFGALEHANSSTYRMPFYAQEAVPSTLASVIAHEYWHLWSPKRFHVHQLGPFDYQQGPETTSLWFAEGLTEYYARAINSRIGIEPPQGFLQEFQRDMSGLYRRKQHEPMTQLSRRITSAPTSELVDLYKKGPLLGFLIDAEIRSQTDNRKSLDDAMRTFNNEYAKLNVTFGDDDIIPIIERSTGAELSDFYARYIAGRDALPFEEAFAQTGLVYVVRDTIKPTLGALLEPSRAGVRVAQIFDSSSASVMGLRVGDILKTIDFDGYAIPVSAVPLEYIDYLFTSADDDSPPTAPRYNARTLTITRDGNVEKLPVQVRMGQSTVQRLDINTSATEGAVAIRRSMLGF